MEKVSPKLTKNTKAVAVHVYADMGKGAVGEQIPDGLHEEFSDRTVQVEGIFGAEGIVVILLGSNDGENFRALSDAHGVQLRFPRAGLKAVSEGALFLRPVVLGGDDTTRLTVTIVSRRPSFRLGG